jgi:hypothetical protein
MCGAQAGCCADLCLGPKGRYHVCRDGESTSARYDNWCACEGTPGAAAGGPTACGEPLACCGPEHSRLGRLMYPEAAAVPAGGKSLCPGEIDLARSGAKEFF